MTYPPAPWPQPGGTAVVAWRTRIGAESYTYAALRIPGSGWFLTGQVTHALSWDELCYCLPPEDGRFLQLGVTGQITPSHHLNQ